MLHKLFYRGQYLGEVSNPLNSWNHAWYCLSCGEVFAKRFAPDPHGWNFWKSHCAKCISDDLYRENPLSEPQLYPDFRLGGDAKDQLATLKAQFLYESTAQGY